MIYDEINKAKKLLESHGYSVSRIDEMSKSWKEIERYLSDQKTSEMLEHLIKYYYWGNVSQTEGDYGFKNEIYNKFNRVSRQSPKNKYPDSSKIFNTIWDAWGDTFDSIEKRLNKESKYRTLPRISIDDKCISFCKDYIYWISEELSDSGFVIREDAYNKVDELYDRYKEK